MDCINNAINAINKGVGNITLLHKKTNQLIRKLETVVLHLLSTFF